MGFFMIGVEEITYKRRVIAIVFRDTIAVSGVHFFTHEKNPFQIGIHKRPKGTSLPPHIHKMAHPLVIKTIQEVLFVVSGKIQVSLYAKNGQTIDTKTLSSGDSILLMGQGHGVDFLEESKIFEIKQGPYPGTTHAKLYLK